MKNIHFLIFATILMSSGNVISSENNSEFGGYCECSFYDAVSNQKLYVGWLGEPSEPEPLVRVNGEKHLKFIKQYENFNKNLGSKCEFLLLDGKNTVKGNLKVTSNCEGSTSGNCEHIGLKGNIELNINGNKSNYNVTGGCGC